MTDQEHPIGPALEPAAEEPEPPAVMPPAVGETVQLVSSRPYLKTADPMPMLRPPDLVDPQETGHVVEIRARGLIAVRFRRGTFLLELEDLTPSTVDP